MKKLNITKEAFQKSRYFTKKYGKLEYVSESGKLFKTTKNKVLRFKESFHQPETDVDVPVTKEEEVLAQYIEECIEEELGIGCSCSPHNPGEEMHLEIVIGEDEYGENTDVNELCADLEKLVNQIGKQEKYDSGVEWGDASFYPQGDYIFGTVYPLEGEFAESTKKFGRKFMKESCDEEFDRYYERMKNIFRYDSGIHIRLRDNEDGSETIEVTFDDRYQWDDDVESGRIPLDKDARLEHWITRFDDAGNRNGWEFDYEIAKDIEHPIDGGANNDYLAMLTLTCKCDKEEDDLLFENSSESTDDMEKEFTYKGVTITRYDYESLPYPMAATKCPDRMMKAIVKSIYYDLIDNCGWSPKNIEKYLAPGVDEYDFEGEEARKTDKIKSDFWEYMEKAAVSYGMKYYEDLPEEENYNESKKARFGRKFKKMDESINWNGVVSKPVPGNPDRVVFTRNCPSCGKPHSIEVDTQDIEQGMSLYQRGARIQDAFPNLSPDEREFFMSGICPDCWENM